jgi:conjugal transfer pilus assembly protein TraE
LRLTQYLASWHGTRATNKLLAVAVVAVATVTIVQSAYLMERERIVVLVPPALQGEAVIGKKAADTPYHTAWAHLLAQMLGNVTPANADFLKARLEPLLDPAIFGAVNQALEQQLDQIRRDRVTLSFLPKKVVHEPESGKTFVTGLSEITGLGGATTRSVRTYEITLEIQDYRVMVKHLATYEGDPRTLDQPEPKPKADQG